MPAAQSAGSGEALPRPLRILQVVWCGIGWDRLQPLLDHELLPTLSLLQKQGTRGQLTGLQPQIPIQLSQSIISGQHAWQHGLVHPISIREDDQFSANTLADAVSPGLPAWLAQANKPAIWVGWPHMTPNSFPSQHMVSRAFASEQGGGLKFDPDLSLPDCRVLESSIGPDHLKPFFPDLTDEDLLSDPAVPALQQLLAEAGSLQAAATRLMQGQQWSVASVRFELSDQISQLFGDCHPPLQDYADPQRVVRYQHMVTGAIRLLDMMLARLVQLSGPDTLIVVHSDKGTAKPAPSSDLSAPVHKRFRAGHEDRGFILLAGQGVRHGEPLYAASILDIAPTLMWAMGLGLPESAGRVLREGLAYAENPETALMDTAPGNTNFESPTLPGKNSRQIIRDDAIAHGESPSLKDLSTQQSETESCLYLALNMLQYGAAAEALPLLEKLNEDYPEDRRYLLHRARCHLVLGQVDLAQQWAEKFVVPGEPDLQSHLLLGRINLLQNRTDQALVHLFQAEQLRPDDPSSHCQIGDAYRQADKPEDARDAFQRALSLDPLDAAAKLGLAKIELLEGNNEAACEICLAALESDYRHADAHFHLGVALARLERIAEAIQAFEACLSLSPQRAPAHDWLARLYKLSKDGLEKAAMHQALALSTATD